MHPNAHIDVRLHRNYRKERCHSSVRNDTDSQAEVCLKGVSVHSHKLSNAGRRQDGNRCGRTTNSLQGTRGCAIPRRVRDHAESYENGPEDCIGNDRQASRLHRTTVTAVLGTPNMPRIPITDEYSLTKRDNSDRWYLEWREGGKKVRRATGTACLKCAKAGHAI